MRRLIYRSLAVVVMCCSIFLVPLLAGAQTASSALVTFSVIVKMAPGLTPEQQGEVIARNGGVEKSSIPALGLHVVEVVATEISTTLDRYRSDSQVVSAEENKQRQWQMAPSDPLYVDQWALPKIGWDAVFGAALPGGRATVAVLDSGVDASHPDLGEIVVGTSILDGSNGLTDPSGHGTALAGIIAARTDTVPVEGIAGVAYAGVGVMPVTVLSVDGKGWDSDVIAGVIWAADHGADVILMAFSDPGFSPALQEAIDYAWAKGVVLVAAAGNSGDSTPNFPAGHRGVIGVSATDPADILAPFSSFGQAAFLGAPGVAIQTTWPGGSYAVVGGTSMSAAVVAGVAGFMRAVDPSLSNGVIVGRIARTADPAGSREQTGNGRINMARALSETGTDPVQPAGADPVGLGGPFVGPYLAASVNIGPHAAVGTNSCDLALKTSFSLGNQVCAMATGLGGPAGPHQIKWYNSSNVLKDTSASSTTGNLQDTYTPDSTGTWTVKAVRVSDGFISASATFTVSDTDTSPPVITPSISGTAGANGWYTSNVTVSWDVSDPDSGIASSTGCATITLSAETTGATVTCSATNGAGASNSASVTVKIDKTGPTAVTLTAVGTQGLNGWYTSDVTVTTTGDDSISGPVTCTAIQSFTADTGGTTVNGSCTNAAGLTTNGAPLSIKLDKTGPTAVLAVTAGTAGSNGWYTSDVTIQTTGTDSLGGPVTCTPDQFQTAETTAAVFNGSCTNAAGLKTDATPLTVKLDKTPPTATLEVTAGTAGLNGWYTSDVTIGATGTDSISSPVTCTAPQTLTSDTAGTTVNGSCTNNAGLKTDAAAVTVKLDKTPPTATLTVTAGTPGANGWYTSPVTLTTSGADSISGPVVCTDLQYQTTETAGAVFNGSCTNAAGLKTNAASLTVKLDTTPPSATLAVTAGTAGNNGWYVSDVTVGTSGADSISTPVVCTAAQYQTTDTAGTVFNGSCTNNAGLSANAAPLTVKLDKTPPTVTFNGDIQNGQSFYFSFVPAQPLCSATDGLSGVASCGVAGYGTAVGPHTLTATATDAAGNTATTTLSFTVLAWTLSGFYQPVDMNGVWNAVKGGSTIPLKFEVFAGAIELTSTSIVSALEKQVTCNAGAEDTVDVVATGGTSLRYDPTAGQFIYNWQSPKLPGKCYSVTLTTLDGSSIAAFFKLK